MGSWDLYFTVSISLDAENMSNEGYQSTLQNLIRFLKMAEKYWVKQEGGGGGGGEGVIYPVLY